MKKDKEWLKGLINEEGIVMDMHLLGRIDEQYWKNENIKINKGRLFYLIDQVDEPEVLSQEWIDKHKYRYDNVELVGVKDLKNLLVSKQEKPVIPQFVADYIEQSKKDNDSINQVFAFMDDKENKDLWHWLFPSMYEEKRANQEVFMRAWLDGYEVEKEKLYYIIDKTNNSTLMTFELSDVVGEEVIEFVYGYSDNETIHFNSKEKAELIAHFIGNSLEVEEVTK